MTSDMKLSITALGASADGIANRPEGSVPDGSVYVPYTLPGETILARVEHERGRLSEVLEPSPDRVKPVCQHFGSCGGCACQHMAPDLYATWKRGLIKTALAKKGIETNISNVISAGMGSRRKAVFSVTSNTNKVVFGFHKEGSHDVVDITQCPVLTQDLEALLPRLRQWIEPFVHAAPDLKISVLSAANGIDINLTNVPQGVARAELVSLTSTADVLNAIRVTRDGDPLYATKEPMIQCGPASIVPPPGTFVQASIDAERKMASLIIDAMPKRTKHVADLFCGIGAFTFPIAKNAHVRSYDTDALAIGALDRAVRHTQSIKTVTATVRDLLQEPLSRRELNDFDAVVFDPPRAGAKNQSAHIAKSTVPVVVAVSCNPATFARDARTLIDGGYVLQNVTPIDQFVYAAHIELVALFQRER